MKKATKIILILFIVTLFVFSLCACENEEEIIGTWVTDDPKHETSFNLDKFIMAVSIQFNADGTVSFVSSKDNSVYDDYTWSYDKSEKAYRIATSEGTEVGFVYIQDNKLYYYRLSKKYDDFGDSWYFTKQ